MKSTPDMAFHIGQTSGVAVVVVPTLAIQDLVITSVVSIHATSPRCCLARAPGLSILLDFDPKKAPHATVKVAEGLSNYTIWKSAFTSQKPR